MTPQPSRRGAALVVALLTLMVVMLITGAVLQSLLSYRRHALLLENELQAEWLAEAAVDRALAKLATGASIPGGQWQATLDAAEPEKTAANINTQIQPATSGPTTSGSTTSSTAQQITATAVYPANSLRQVTATRTYTLSK